MKEGMLLHIVGPERYLLRNHCCGSSHMSTSVQHVATIAATN